MTPVKRPRLDADDYLGLGNDSDAILRVAFNSNDWEIDSDSEDSVNYEYGDDSFQQPASHIWKEPDENARAFVHTFNQERAGQIKTPLGQAHPVDYFRQIFTRTLLEIIVEETNRHANANTRQVEPETPRSHHKPWNDLTVDELQAFFGIILLMGHRIHDDYTDYWSTDELIHAPIFGLVMPCDRFRSIMRYLSFTNAENIPSKNSPIYDRLWKLRTILQFLNEKFKELYNPTESMSINEAVIECQGEVMFKHVISKKKKQVGINLYKLCDTNAYTYDLIAYVEKEVGFLKESIPPAYTLALQLTSTVQGKGHKIYMDSAFTSPMLLSELLDHRTNACGAFSRRARDVPKNFLAKDFGLKCGEFRAVYSSGITAMCYMDTQQLGLCLLSTLHSPGELSHQEKPQIVEDYQKQMKYAEKSMRMANSYTSVRKTDDWIRKLFFHFLDIAVLNAFILMRSEKNVISHKVFRINLIRELMRNHVNELALTRPLKVCRQEVHRLEYKSSEHWPARGSSQRRCKVCTVKKVRRSTMFYCPKCNVGLCIAGCFARYHTEVDF